MPLTEAHLVPLMVAMVVFALVLGLLANVLAVRLMLDRGKAANDATYEHAKIAYRSRRPAERAALKLVPPLVPPRPLSRRVAARPYFPELATKSAQEPLLKRVSQE